MTGETRSPTREGVKAPFREAPPHPALCRRRSLDVMPPVVVALGVMGRRRLGVMAAVSRCGLVMAVAAVVMPRRRRRAGRVPVAVVVHGLGRGGLGGGEGRGGGERHQDSLHRHFLSHFKASAGAKAGRRAGAPCTSSPAAPHLSHPKMRGQPNRAAELTGAQQSFLYLRRRATPSQRGAAHLQGWETS